MPGPSWLSSPRPSVRKPMRSLRGLGHEILGPSSSLCNLWQMLKSAMPIRMMAGVPTVPQPPHATTFFVTDTASAHVP